MSMELLAAVADAIMEEKKRDRGYTKQLQEFYDIFKSYEDEPAVYSNGELIDEDKN